MAERVSNLFWVLFSGLLLYETRRYPIGTVDHPGSGFLPLLLGIVLGALSIIHFFKAWISKEGQASSPLWPNRAGLIRAASIFVLLLLFTLLLEVTGYLVNIFFLFLVLLRPVGKQKWLWSLLISAGATFASYLLFDWWLMLPLPKGLWFE